MTSSFDAWLAAPDDDRTINAQKTALLKERRADLHHWLALSRTVALSWLLHAHGRGDEARRLVAEAHGAAGIDTGGNCVDMFGATALGSSWWFARAAGDDAEAASLAAKLSTRGAPEIDATVLSLRGDIDRAATEAPPLALNTLGRALSSLAARAALGDARAAGVIAEGEAALSQRFVKKKAAAKKPPPPSSENADAKPSALLDGSAKKLSASLRAAASCGGSLGAMFTRCADVYDTQALRKAASLKALVHLAAALFATERFADVLTLTELVLGPSTARVSQSATPRARAGALKVLALRGAGDKAAAERAEEALGHSSFGVARGSKDDAALWARTAQDVVAEWEALRPLTDVDAVAEGCALLADCLYVEYDAWGDAQEKVRALRVERITPALQRALNP